MHKISNIEDVNWAPWVPVMVRIIQIYMNLPDVPRYSAAEMAFRSRGALFELLGKVEDLEPQHFDRPTYPDDTWLEMLRHAALAMTRVDGPPNAA